LYLNKEDSTLNSLIDNLLIKNKIFDFDILPLNMSKGSYVYSIYLNRSLSSNELNSILYFLDDSRIENILSHRLKKDRERMAFASVLQIYSILKMTNIDFSHIKFETGINGKPMLKDNKSIDFNVSHSGDIIVSAISKKPVGIDIEVWGDHDVEGIAKRFFTQEESNKIKNSINRQQSFHNIWTKKESYLKMLGLGLIDNLNQLDYKSCKFTHFNGFKNYSLCLCESNI
jgi:4'-phosphopantetheinyl transferase